MTDNPMQLRNTTLLQLAFAFLVLLSGQVLGADRDNDSMVAQGGPSTQGINRAVKDLNYYLEMQDFPAALAEAERIVLLQENSPGQPPLNKATALHDLANVQQVMHQHLKSEKNYKKSIQLIERQLGEHASELINVLNHLGLLYAGTSDYELATDAFRRAQHITHRIDGVGSQGMPTRNSTSTIPSILRIMAKTIPACCRP